MDKGHEKEGLLCLRKEICDRYIENKSCKTVETSDPPRDRTPLCYKQAVRAWHERREGYEISLYAATAVLPSDSSALSLAVVLYILKVNVSSFCNTLALGPASSLSPGIRQSGA